MPSLWYLPPANEVCEGYVFTGVCLSTPVGGHAWFYSGGHAWFYSGGVHGFIWGGMRGFIRGACMVLFGGACMVLFGGHAWFYLGGMHGSIWGACVVLFGGMHGFIWGACMVLFGGCAWFYLGGMRGFIWGGMHGFFGYNQIRSMSGRYASYWNAFLCRINHWLTLIVHPCRNLHYCPPTKLREGNVFSRVSVCLCVCLHTEA